MIRCVSLTAVSTYESPSHIGPPLAYTTISEVTLQQPDKLRVMTPGDGPASKFYDDGKTMTVSKSNIVLKPWRPVRLTSSTSTTFSITVNLRFGTVSSVVER